MPRSPPFYPSNAYRVLQLRKESSSLICFASSEATSTGEMSMPRARASRSLACEIVFKT